jgi:hypothetical protein
MCTRAAPSEQMRAITYQPMGAKRISDIPSGSAENAGELGEDRPINLRGSHDWI